MIAGMNWDRKKAQIGAGLALLIAGVARLLLPSDTHTPWLNAFAIVLGAGGILQALLMGRKPPA